MVEHLKDPLVYPNHNNERTTPQKKSVVKSAAKKPKTKTKEEGKKRRPKRKPFEKPKKQKWISIIGE